MKIIIYKNLSYQLNGIFFQIHNEYGRFLRERQCCDLLEEALEKNSIRYQREYDLARLNKEFLKGNRVDYLIEDKIIIEVKATSIITKEDYCQVLRYLQASNMRLGMIVNFRNKYLKAKRAVNNKFIN